MKRTSAVKGRLASLRTSGLREKRLGGLAYTPLARRGRSLLKFRAYDLGTIQGARGRPWLAIEEKRGIGVPKGILHYENADIPHIEISFIVGIKRG